MADDEMQERRFVYAGRRLLTKGGLCHAWLPEGVAADSNEVRLFPKAKANIIGGIYTITVGDDSYQPASVNWTGEYVERDVKLELEAADHTDAVRHRKVTLAKNAARSSEIKELCAPLRALVGKQVGWEARAALLAYINSEISRG